MRPCEDEKLLEVVITTGEIYGKQVSLAAVVMFLADLDGYSSDQISMALAKCRKDLKTFPSVSDVIARINDGRPGVEEAWAMIPKDENRSVVWTKEMAEAFGVCRCLLQDDPIAARMAFKETYLRLTSEARMQNKPIEWQPSLGLDIDGREDVLKIAFEKQQLTFEHVRSILPGIAIEALKRVQLSGPA